MARLGELGVLVTGGVGAVGEAIVRRLLAEGADVVIADRRIHEGEHLASALGQRCSFVALDVRKPNEWEKAVATASERVCLRGLVNNAGVLSTGPLADMAVSDIAEVIDINLTGAVLGTHFVTDAIAANGGGAIVNVASIDGGYSGADAAACTAASWGLRGLTRASAGELGRFGIRVNAVCPSIGDPGAVLADDGRPREVTQGDVAAMVAFLLSDDSATCTGSDFVVDAGSRTGNDPALQR